MNSLPKQLPGVLTLTGAGLVSLTTLSCFRLSPLLSCLQNNQEQQLCDPQNRPMSALRHPFPSNLSLPRVLVPSQPSPTRLYIFLATSPASP